MAAWDDWEDAGGTAVAAAPWADWEDYAPPAPVAPAGPPQELEQAAAQQEIEAGTYGAGATKVPPGLAEMLDQAGAQAEGQQAIEASPFWSGNPEPAEESAYGFSQAPPKVPGLLEPGNVDLKNRPRVQNPDGSYSTVNSYSFEEDGKEVVVPGVAADGSRKLDPLEALDQYHATGQHLGRFDSARNASRYAEQLHQEQEAQYSPDSYGFTEPPGAPSRVPAQALALLQGAERVQRNYQQGALETVAGLMPWRALGEAATPLAGATSAVVRSAKMADQIMKGYPWAEAAEQAFGPAKEQGKALAQFMTPLASVPDEIEKTINVISDIEKGKSWEKTAKDNYPEAFTIKEAEASEAFSKERFKAGFNMLAQFGMAAAMVRGHPKANKQLSLEELLNAEARRRTKETTTRGREETAGPESRGAGEPIRKPAPEGQGQQQGGGPQGRETGEPRPEGEPAEGAKGGTGEGTGTGGIAESRDAQADTLEGQPKPAVSGPEGGPEIRGGEAEGQGLALSKNSPAVSERVAGELGLKYNGVQEYGEGIPHEILFTDLTPGKETTLAVPEGTTRAQLEARLAEKRAQYDETGTTAPAGGRGTSGDRKVLGQGDEPAPPDAGAGAAKGANLPQPNPHGVLTAAEGDTITLPNPKKGWRGLPLAEVRVAETADGWRAGLTTAGGGYAPNVRHRAFPTREAALHAALNETEQFANRARGGGMATDKEIDRVLKWVKEERARLPKGRAPVKGSGLQWEKTASASPGGKKWFWTAETPRGRRSVAWNRQEENWQVTGGQTVRRFKTAEEAKDFVQRGEPKGRAPVKGDGGFSDDPLVSFVRDEMGGIMSRTAAMKKLGKEKFAANASEWENATTFPDPRQTKVYNQASGQMPNKVAQMAADRGLLPPGAAAPELWQALQKVADSAHRNAKAERAERANMERAEVQSRKFTAAAARQDKGDATIHASDLKQGDSVTIGGEKFKVTEIDPESFDVTLEDGKKYGVQHVEDDMVFYGEHKPAPKRKAAANEVFKPSKDKDAIGGPALRLPDGRIIAGQLGDLHGELYDRAPYNQAGGRYEEGFVSNRGEWLTREQAWERGKQKNQLTERALRPQPEPPPMWKTTGERQLDSTEIEVPPAEELYTPKLRQDQKQGDIFGGSEDLTLVGEKGVDYAARQAAAEAAERAKAEAQAEIARTHDDLFADQETGKPPAPAGEPPPQGELFLKAQAETLPRQVSAEVPVPGGGLRAPTAAEIREYFSKAFDIPILQGMNVSAGAKSAEGVYRVKPETIHTATRNRIPTIAHELGHYLHHLLFADPVTGKPMDWAKGFDHELLPLGRKTSGVTSTAPQIRVEGVAEYMRHWLYDRSAAYAKAPDFSYFFEKELQAKYPQSYEILENGRKMIKRWLDQPAVERGKSKIVFDYKPERGSFRNWLSAQYNHWFEPLNPIWKAGEKLIDFGADPAIALRSFQLANNHRGGWKGKAEHDLEWTQTNLRGEAIGPGLRAILKGLDRESAKDFSYYATLHRAKEKGRQFVNGKRILTGFEEDLANPKIQQWMRDQSKQFEPMRQKVLQYNRNSMDLLKDSGHFTDAQLKAIRALNEDYVPMYRIFETINGNAHGIGGVGSGYVNVGSGVRRMTGSDRLILDPLQSMVKNTYMFRDLAERNQVGVALVKAIEATQGAGRIGERMLRETRPEKVSHEEVLRKIESLGIEEGDALAQVIKDDPTAADLTMTIFRASEGVKASQGEFRVWIDGKERLYQVRDPELYRALTLADSGDVAALTGWRKIPAGFARGLRTGATLVPEFIVRNLARDQFTAGINSPHGYVPYVSGIRGLASVIGKQRGHWYKDYVRAGAKFSGLYDVPGGSHAKTLQTVLRHDPNALRIALDLLNPLRIKHNLQVASQALEEATRVSEFRLARLAGKSEMEAAAAAKDVTLNFASGGAHAKAINAYVTFFNAKVLDVKKFAEMHKDPKTAARTAAKAALYVTLPSIYTWMAGKDDPLIQKLPEWRKTMFWNLNINGNVYSWPKPFLYGAVYGTLVEKGLDYATARDPNAMAKAGSAIIQNIGVGNDISGVIPTIGKPIIENIANYNFFTGEKVVSQAQERLSPENQYSPVTSETAKWIGGKFGISPLKIDNAVRGYAAGSGKYGTDFIDWAFLKHWGTDTPAEPPAKQTAQFPIIRGFTPSPYEQSEYVKRFYKGVDRAETRLNDFSAMSDRLETEKQKQFYLKNRNALMWYSVDTTEEQTGTTMTELRRIRNKMSDYGKAMVAIQESRQITPQDKAERLRKITRLRNDLAEYGFKTFVHPEDREKVF